MDHTVQDTLDAFETAGSGEVHPSSEGDGGNGRAIDVVGSPDSPSRPSSIDAFLVAGAVPPTGAGQDVSTRAMEGIALEMSMERIAMTEASAGITRDELLVTIAREIQLPLQRLDLVDGYITDLELEGKLRRVGDLVVLAQPGDEDLLAMDLDEEEFLYRYKRRHTSSRGGGG